MLRLLLLLTLTVILRLISLDVAGMMMPLSFIHAAVDYIQVEALGSGPDALDVRLTMAGIEDSPFAEFRSTELAGRVAAVCGVRSLAELAASSEERVSVPAGGFIGKIYIYIYNII